VATRAGTRFRIAARLKGAVVRSSLTALRPVFPTLVKHAATTGYLTDACLKKGALPVPVHFYQPVPDVDDLAARAVWSKTSALAGVDLRADEQLDLLATLGEQFGDECRWPAHGDRNQAPFFSENGSFGYACASTTYSIMRHRKPRRVVEVGSGMSTRVIAQALVTNRGDGVDATYRVVDPYPSEVVASLDGVSELSATRVEEEPLSTFEALEAGDVLFIDSGHTVRIGGDVNYLFLDVLPRLNPGVMVHIHDIPLPAEYPETYARNPSFRVYWTEAYLLQAFLAFNTAFEVRLAMTWMHMTQPGQFEAAFPHHVDEPRRLDGSGFWIERV
jgi:hypothetical protein